MKAEELAQQYADASATWHVESLYGGSKSYTAEMLKEKQSAGAALFTELRRQSSEIERLEAIEASARNLVKVKGRYHTEQAFKALAALLEKSNG